VSERRQPVVGRRVRPASTRVRMIGVMLGRAGCMRREGSVLLGTGKLLRGACCAPQGGEESGERRGAER
jgi:hypothetical protein